MAAAAAVAAVAVVVAVVFRPRPMEPADRIVVEDIHARARPLETAAPSGDGGKLHSLYPNAYYRMLMLIKWLDIRVLWSWLPVWLRWLLLNGEGLDQGRDSARSLYDGVGE